MKRKVLLVDIQGVYRAQGFCSWMEESGIPFEVAGVEGLQGTHCYCDAEAEEALLAETGSADAGIRFIGSGDYHYITCLLAQGIKEPFSLVLMDHHPDDQLPALGDVLSCGGWVQTLKERCAALEDVLTIGPEGCPQDIPGEWLESHREKNIYLSLDKDIMSPQYAVTGWSQGSHSLEDVKRMIGKFMGMNVIAVDVCGETAPENCQAVNLEANKEILTHIINALYD